VYACKGQHGDMVLPSRKVRIDRYPDGKPIPGGLTLLHVNTWRYKGMLLGRMRQPPPAMVGHDSSIGDDESRWWWPDPDVDAEGRELRERLLDYFEMLAAEQLVIVNERAVQRGARPEYEWRLRPKRYANHYLDAEVYAWAVAESDFPNITRAYMEALLAKAAAGKAPAAPPATERRRSGKVIEEVRSDYRERYGWAG
jgi:phage terminase large subunit GpA-like protein